MKRNTDLHRDGHCRLVSSDSHLQKGTALVIVLLIVAILVSLATHFSYGTRVELALSGHIEDRLKTYRLLKSGYEVGVGALQRDTNDYDALTDLWARSDLLPLGMSLLSISGRVNGTVTDENTKLNLNLIVDDRGRVREGRELQLRRLFQVLGLDDQPVESLLDWLDSDDEVRPGGAERSYYSQRTPPYACPNGPLETLNQLLLIRGWTRELLFGNQESPGLSRFLTIHSDGRININTAPAEILRTLDDALDETLTHAIVGNRAESPFEKSQDLKRVAGVDAMLYSRILSMLTVKSTYFSIEVYAGEGSANMELHAVVNRTLGRITPVYWRIGP